MGTLIYDFLKNIGYHHPIHPPFTHVPVGLVIAGFIFILLAFFVHQILELTDPLFQECRRKFSARKEFWNQLRCTIRILIFESWTHLLEFVRDPP